MPVEDLFGHLAAPARPNDVENDLAVAEHPVPPVLAPHAHARLVAVDDAGLAQPGKDRGELGVEAGLGALEQRVERPLADGEAEQIVEQPDEPLAADVLDRP